MTGVADSLRAAVRTALHDAGISQAEASRRLGLSTKHMSHMLTGRAVLTLDWAEQILALCGKRLSVKVVADKETLPMAQPSPADQLRTAAEKLRTAASDATPGPWRQHDTHLDLGGHTATVLSGKGNDTQLRAWLPTMSHEPWDETRNVWADAAYIALMGPSVGDLLAKWLDFEADQLSTCPSSEYYVRTSFALAVARQILGGDTP